MSSGGGSDKWIAFDPPAQISARTLRNAAEWCAWRIQTQGSSTRICLEERYKASRSHLIELMPVVDADGTLGQGWDHLPTLSPVAGIDQAAVEGEVGDRINEGTAASLWSAWKLLILAAPDAVLQSNLAGMHDRVTSSHSGASLLLAHVDPLVLKRASFLRILFAAQHAPELLARPTERFSGIESARELGSGPAMIPVHSLMGLYCAWPAPWMIGIATPRVPSVFVTLGETPWLGIVDPSPALLDSMSPQVLSTPLRGGYTAPRTSAAEALAGLKWWTNACSRLCTCLLDPSNFPNSNRSYDPGIHFLTVLSFDRLVASALASVSAAPGQEYVRKLLFFEGIEILEGLGFGSVEQTCNFRKLNDDLEVLRQRLPIPVGEILLPRCERALEALQAVAEGYFPERRKDGKVKLSDKGGLDSSLDEAAAVSVYLRAVRNGTHGYKGLNKKPRAMSALAAHDGSISPFVPDLVLIHILKIMLDPQNALFPHSNRP